MKLRIPWQLRYFFESIKNLIRWFPVIWKDKDFDHWFIYKILYKKIKNIRKRYEKHQYFVGQEIEVKWLKICEYLLDYILKSKSWEDIEEAKYLNYKNIDYILKNPDLMNCIHWKCDAREEKAQDLFWKIISWRSRCWWD